MQLTSIVASLALTATAVASPGGWGGWGGWGNPSSCSCPSALPTPKPAPCLTQAGVDKLVQGYTYLLEHPGGPDFNSTARSILSDKFFVYSDSINTLSQRPLGSPAYPSREIFIATQFQTPALPVVQTLATFNTCNQIGWRWNASGIGSNMYPIRGIITMDVNAATTQIDALYSEFNTLAFSADLGSPECKQK